MAELIGLFVCEQAAQARIPGAFFGYTAGGAADEITLRENRTAFNRLKLRPRVPTNVSHRTVETTIVGHATAMPRSGFRQQVSPGVGQRDPSLKLVLKRPEETIRRNSR